MSNRMKMIVFFAALITLLIVTAASFNSPMADGVEVVVTFDPSLAEFPEGLAVDKTGNIYVGLGPPGAPFGEIRRIATDGTITSVTLLPGAPAGLAVDAPGNVYYAMSTTDPATSGVYRMTPDGHSDRLPGTENIILANGLAFDKRGNLYISDSIPGIVWRVSKDGTAEAWFQHPWLLGCGLDPSFPPVGANGVAFWHNDLYVASTEQGLILRIPVNWDGSAGEAEIVAGIADCDAEMTDIDSVDGIAMDIHGDIYALLVIQNKMVKVDTESGDITYMYDDSDGLHNPASIAFGTGRANRKSAFISNFGLIPPGSGPAVVKAYVGEPGVPLP